MTEIDELRRMLMDAGIPFESRIEESKFPRSCATELFGAAGKYDRNQVIYGRREKGWKFDAIWQYGSYGAKEGLLETYGPLGVDDEGNPRVMTAREAFEIIKADWEEADDRRD